MKKVKKENDLIDELGSVHRGGPTLAEINDTFPSDHELSLREAAKSRPLQGNCARI